jgi:hypothetical protein
MKISGSVVQPLAIEGLKVGVAPAVSFSGVLEKVRSLWVATESSSIKNLPGLPPELRKLFELQRSTGALQLQVECISRVADSVGQTVRRVHQLGGGQ